RARLAAAERSLPERLAAAQGTRRPGRKARGAGRGPAGPRRPWSSSVAREGARGGGFPRPRRPLACITLTNPVYRGIILLSQRARARSFPLRTPHTQATEGDRRAVVRGHRSAAPSDAATG